MLTLRAYCQQIVRAGDDRASVELIAPAQFPENREQLQNDARVSVPAVPFELANQFQQGRQYRITVEEITR